MDFTGIGTALGGIALTAATAWATIKAGLSERRANEAKTEASQANAKVSEVSDKARVSSDAASSDLAKAKEDLAISYKQAAEEWKALAEKNHKELVDYRVYVHEKAKDDQKVILSLTEENAGLKTKTDIKPIILQMEQVTTALAAVARVVETLESRMMAYIQGMPQPNTTKP